MNATETPKTAAMPSNALELLLSSNTIANDEALFARLAAIEEVSLRPLLLFAAS
jgi:hypothetical protein